MFRRGVESIKISLQETMHVGYRYFITLSIEDVIVSNYKYKRPKQSVASGLRVQPTICAITYSKHISVNKSQCHCH